MTQNCEKSFYPVTAEISQKLRQAKLTAAEYRIWLYLIEVDPWGDRYKDLETLKVIEECEVSKATFYRAIAKFQELEVFDFQDKGFSIRNLCGAAVSKTRKTQSQDCEKSLKTEKKVSKMRQNSQNCENQPLEASHSKGSEVSQTIQTNKTNKIRSRDENFDLKEPEIKAKKDRDAIENKDDPEKDFKDFIIKRIETERKITIASPEAYLNKVLSKDAGKWRSLYAESKEPVKARDVITEDIWRLEQSLNQAIRMNDLEFAIAKLEGLTDIREQIFIRHPEWRELLCG